MESQPQLRRSLQLNSPYKERLLIADLPKNSTVFASIAEEAGVHAIILNIDGDEGSDPNHFGSYDLHDAYINDVISTVSIPCGIQVGGGRAITEEYWERVMSSNFSFVEMYAHHMPLFITSDNRIAKIVAIATGYILEQVRNISLMEHVEAIDVAAAQPHSRGSPFNVLDYATLGVVRSVSSKAVLLRTQKKMTGSDIEKVQSLGVNGFVIDPCTLSGGEETYKEDLLRFAIGRSTIMTEGSDVPV